jgi:hypothetical protein
MSRLTVVGSSDGLHEEDPMKHTATAQPDLGTLVHRRAAPPAWLVPSSPEVSNHHVVAHLRRCGVRVHDLFDYTCPCEPGGLVHVTCTSCTGTVVVIAGEPCPHLQQFVDDGVPVRWWAA